MQLYIIRASTFLSTKLFVEPKFKKVRFGSEKKAQFGKRVQFGKKSSVRPKSILLFDFVYRQAMDVLALK
jgi:hypothetical protein